MTKKNWIGLAVMFSTALGVAAFSGAPAFVADPPVIPADLPPPNPPKADPKKKAAAPKKVSTKAAASPKKSNDVVVLAQPESAVVSQKNVNIRGQALVTSEVVAHLKKGDKVTVLEEITTKKKKDEPDKWYKIALPPTSPVWINTSIGLDADKKVKPNRLNLRSGPGENYSVIGRADKGTAVTVIETKGEWSRIEPPAGSFAFVAAHLVTREPAGSTTIASHTPPVAPPVTPPPITVVNATPPVVVAPPVEPTPPPVTPPPVVAPPGLVPVVRPTPTPPPEEPLVKRVVTREGIVKNSVSVQAPTHFVLRGIDNNKTLNYLFSPSTNILLKT
ncbi:MAG: N-acetylmuramoyl-L-alanine amidase, partial [Verrucomicrobiota bacterium]